MKSIMTFILLLLLSNVMALSQSVSFSNDVYPIFKAKCLKCHEQDDENPSNFAMDNLQLMRTSGKTKNMIIPGDGAGSFLYKKLLPNPPVGAQMPLFSKKKLNEEQVAIIKKWIDQGAKDN